jgi:hypothetical protein
MFMKLGIHVISCAWEEGTAVFDGLEEGDPGRGGRDEKEVPE